jgi:hypothetical protein
MKRFSVHFNFHVQHFDNRVNAVVGALMKGGRQKQMANNSWTLLTMIDSMVTQIAPYEFY